MKHLLIRLLMKYHYYSSGDLGKWEKLNNKRKK